MRKLIYALCLSSLFTLAGYAQDKLSLEDQRKFDYYFYEAINAKALDKYDVAFDYIQYCHQLDSTNANILHEMGIFCSSMNKVDQATNFYRKATQYAPENIYYRMAFASMCLQLKQYTDAIEHLEYVTEHAPDKPEPYLYLAESYRQTGDLEKAIEALNKLEQNIGLNEQISMQKLQLYTSLNQESKGFEEIQKYIDKHPNEIKYRLMLGNLYMLANKTDEAFKVYSEAKTLEPENPYLISSMSEYYERIGDNKAADNELQTAILSPDMDIDTKLSILSQYVARLQMSKKGTETVNPLLEKLMELHPQAPQLNLMHGELLMAQDKKAEAYPHFQIYAEARPTEPTGWEQMLAASFPDSIQQAIYTCQKAIEYIPEAPQFYFYLAISQTVEKKYEEALESLKGGVDYAKQTNRLLASNFYGQMGDIYFQLNKVDSAFKSYDEALFYDPQNILVLNNYSYYLSLLRKDLDRAEKMSSITIKAEPSNPTYLDTYGWILFEQGAFAMAKIYIERAIRYIEESKEELSGDILEHYGDVLFKTGEEEKALEYWIKARKAKNEGKEDEDYSILDKKIETKTYIVKDKKENEIKK